MKTWIEGLWCVLGGFCFTVFVHVNEPEYFRWRSLDWYYWWDHYGRAGDNPYHFLFGFIVTLILIWSIKFYRRQL